ncbi:MAG: T9SS type A sorting domain-containing protein [Bacteroidetes bacterium]|nr:T9SS type A sorting domain-containing protein [Bacteroidota bacterium]
MKKITILLFVLLQSAVAMSQSEYPVLIEQLSRKEVALPENHSIKNLWKTSSDVLAFDSSTVIDCENEIGGSFLGDFIPSTITSSNGYLGGTTENGYDLGPVPDARTHGFGNLYTVNGTSLVNQNVNWTGATSRGDVYLEEIIFPSIGEEKLYTSIKVGTADEFEVRIHDHTPGLRWPASTIAPCLPTSPRIDNAVAPIAVRTFTLDDLANENEPHRIVLDPPVLLPSDSFWIYIRVDTLGNDDTLAPALVDGSLFSADGPSFQCGNKAHSVVGYYRKEADNTFLNIQRLAITQYRSYSPACPGSFLYSEFLLFPVFGTSTQVLSRGGGLTQGNIRINEVYPNPATSKLNVKYELNATTHVGFRILDSKLRVMAQVEDGLQTPGNYQREFTTNNYAAGVYYLQTAHGGQVLTQKFVVVK